jgi:hypothetical protein
MILGMCGICLEPSVVASVMPVGALTVYRGISRDRIFSFLESEL